MSTLKTYVRLIIIFYFLAISQIHSQEPLTQGTFQIEKLIQADSLPEAQNLLKHKVEQFRNEKNFDSLVTYIELVGSHALSNGNKQLAYEKAVQFVDEIKTSKNPIIISLALQNLGYLHSAYGQPQETYDLYYESYQLAKNSNDPQKVRLANIKYKLGHTAQSMSDFQLAKKHYLEAAEILNSWKSTDVEFYQQIYNALGGMMWMESKLDSSSYYFNKSLVALKKADKKDLMNSQFRPALIKMNLSVLKNALGETQQAIILSEESIIGFGEYISRSNDEFRIISAKKHRTTAIENLGSYYHSKGEFKKAEKLVSYANSEKKKIFDPNSSSMIISRIVLAQAKIGIRDFTTAKHLLEEALQIMEENPGVENYWKSGALTTLGNVYADLGDNEKAYKYFSLGGTEYKNTLKGEYNKDYFDVLINMSNFYAKAGYHDKALEIANEIYNEAKNGDFKNTLQDFRHTVNLAKIYFELGKYKNAILYAEEAITFELDKENNNGIEYLKPHALYILISSEYALDPNVSTATLISYLKKIEEGFKILEIRKAALKNYEDVSLFIDENNQLFELAKKIRLELFQRTKNEQYLNDVIALHESSMYSRIRSRLNLRNEKIASKLPTEVIEREKQLKSQLNSHVFNEVSSSITNSFELNKTWNNFRDSLKINYPEYYKLQYATLEESIHDIKDYLDAETTLIRYLFVEDHLYGFVFTNSSQHLYEIETADLKSLIGDVSSQEFDINILAPKLHQLYKILWQPFENKISGNNIIIIPDRELFNLSFEMLTPELLSSFSEIKENSLLALYNISYQFSLLVMNPKQHVVNTYDSNFVAFAPEFSDKMKVHYQLTVKDSTSLDNTYLNLLPQPFSVDIIKKYSKQFDGDSYLNEKASKSLFKETAGEHKIIHIGTHAESDNVSPELSRLIFAKNHDGENLEDNYLHTYEIYNYNLSSNLAILTACETGKPGYQAGEGMISLAHAFNYAGSESILTSLWEIDEESSSKILGLFYENLSKGMAKDAALRQAKLDYILTARGRTASPQYWAGLVLIGDTAPLTIKSSSSIWYWIAGIILLSSIVFLLFRRK